MEIGIKQAKIQLSQLIQAAESGERVYLMNRGKRVAEVVPVKQETGPERGYGFLKDKTQLPKGWGSQKFREQAEREFLSEIEGLE